MKIAVIEFTTKARMEIVAPSSKAVGAWPEEQIADFKAEVTREAMKNSQIADLQVEVQRAEVVEVQV